MLKLVQDYINQEARFLVYEGFGCFDAVETSILTLLVIRFLPVILPLLSITLYYRM